MDPLFRSSEPIGPVGGTTHLDALVPNWMREEVSTGVCLQLYHSLIAFVLIIIKL